MDAQQRLDSAVSAAMSSVPACVACGLVDLDSGVLLGAKQTTNHPQAVLDMTAAATQDFFEGDSVKTIEAMIAESRGAKGESLIDSVVMFTRGTQHLMVRGGAGGRQVVVFVCGLNANIGMILAKGSAAAKKIFSSYS